MRNNFRIKSTMHVIKKFLLKKLSSDFLTFNKVNSKCRRKFNWYDDRMITITIADSLI